MVDGAMAAAADGEAMGEAADCDGAKPSCCCCSAAAGAN